ncbi:DNA polymerase lambda [Cercospora beticola]|uniref:DNA polymerase lambda n=2 Tax=Cercospora beticola TaxID=122368 RepID=A0A2G5I8M0_CERBT|nr:DNA polymerase lambda [Cercospora beticola]PIB01141.1 DNA polymerase lambda [Cercospora beticola]
MTSNMNDYLAKKKQVFDALDKLDNSSDDEPDLGRQASEDALKRAAARGQQKHAALASKAEKRPLARSISDNTGAFQGREANQDATINSSPPKNSAARERRSVVPSSTDPKSANVPPKPPLPRGLRQTVSDISSGQRSKPGTTQVTGKRKREASIKLVPEAIQVFRDLHFYFFPNNDSAPARRMRITKAREYGAVWHQTWGKDITHVVVDKSMTFDDLKKWLKVDSIPQSVIVVNDVYPAECITYGVLLDPSPTRFAVKGFVPPKTSGIDSVESDKSLKLKPAKGKAQMERRAETPPREDELAAVASAVVAGHPVDDSLDDPARVANSFQFSSVASNSELDDAIAKAKALQAIHIGEEEDEDRPNSSEGLGSGEQEKKPGLQLVATRKTKFKEARDRWQCMQKNTGANSDNPNSGTIEILQQMADYYGQTGDEWRIRAYRKAIATLKNHPIKVTTKEEAGALPNIGPRLAEKIEEIAFTNRLRRLENAKAEPSDQLLQTFMGVYGAGIKQATEWVHQGYQTLDDLLAKAPLTTNQRIGIEHYTDFNSRIPRSEVAQHGAIVRNALKQLDPTFEVIIGGSYRRGASDSGDIDCIITRPNTGAAHLRNIIMNQLVPSLTAQNFLVANLAMKSKDDGSKWHGASCLPGSKIWRRMDLLLVPSDEIGAALIYFTGNDIFNRSLRLLASTKGMRLNQRGLYKDVLRGKGREKLAEGTLVEGRDEKRIFEILGVKWRPPEERIC